MTTELNSGTLLLVPFSEFERIRNLPVSIEERAAIFADMCRINSLYMISFAGSGHVGSSLSSLDIVSWLYLAGMKNPGENSGDVYFSSKGHDAPGLYSALIGMGLLPFENVDKLRRLGGLPGHPDIGTPHIPTNTGSLGMGISKARGMALAGRLSGKKRRYYVLLGDGELQEGQFWESLVPTANRGVSEIFAIVDHNKLQSDTFVSQVSDLGDLAVRVEACGWEVARCDGHDMNAIGSALAKLSESPKPKFLIADTIKGKGAGPMESSRFTVDQRLYKFHSGSPAPEIYIEGVLQLVDAVQNRLAKINAAPLEYKIKPRPVEAGVSSPQKLVGAYSEALLEQARKNKNLVALSADLALDTGLIPFEREFPERFFECGIAEMDMVSQAGGMALSGLLPVVHSFSCFLSTRPNEQIFNNATEKTRIIYTGSLAGIIPGGPGHSHQSIRDIAALSGTPGLTMLEPCCEAEVAMAFDYCVNKAPGSSYLRLVSVPCDIPFKLPANYTLERGKGAVILGGADVAIVGYGPVTLSEAYKAAQSFAAEGLGVKVINLPWLNTVDADWLLKTIGAAKLLVTLDNHYLDCGQGAMIRSELAGSSLKIVSLGMTGIAQCGKNHEVLRAHGLDAEGIKASIQRCFVEANGK